MYARSRPSGVERGTSPKAIVTKVLESELQKLLDCSSHLQVHAAAGLKLLQRRKKRAGNVPPTPTPLPLPKEVKEVPPAIHHRPENEELNHANASKRQISAPEKLTLAEACAKADEAAAKASSDNEERPVMRCESPSPLSLPKEVKEKHQDRCSLQANAWKRQISGDEAAEASHQETVRVTLASILSGAAKRFETKSFEEVDKDGDGVITQEEITASLAEMQVDTKEAEEAQKQIMQMADKDGDGVISKQELDQAKEKVTSEDPKPPVAEAAHPKDTEARDSKEEAEASHYQLVRGTLASILSGAAKRFETKSFEEVDKDGDGVIAQEEITASLAERQVDSKEAEEAKQQITSMGDKDPKELPPWFREALGTKVLESHLRTLLASSKLEVHATAALKRLYRRKKRTNANHQERAHTADVPRMMRRERNFAWDDELPRGPFRLVCGFCEKPHAEKAATGGEDSFFISPNGLAAGVADGVGQFSLKYGLNPRHFADELMNGAKIAGEQIQHQVGLAAETRAQLMLSEGYQATKSFGAATALVAALHPREAKLGVANLGDSGLRVLRWNDGFANGPRGVRIVYRTSEQQHDFNQPYQLSRLPQPKDFEDLKTKGLTSLLSDMEKYYRSKKKQDLPSDSDTYTFKVEEGDVVLLGTDGIFDNLDDKEVCDLARRAFEGGSQIEANRLAEAFAEAACLRSKDARAATPFSTAATHHSGVQQMGGKQDDITVVACVVTRT